MSATPAWGVTLSPTAAPSTWGTDGRIAEILPLPDGSTVLAGTFGNVIDPAGGLHPAANIAKLDASGAWVPSFAAATDGAVAALAYAGGRVYVGGSFTSVDAVAHPRLAAVDSMTGALDTGFQATTDAPVAALVATATNLYAGGEFRTVTTPDQGAVPRLRVAKLTLDSGAVDPSWRMHPNRQVRSLVASPDGQTLYAAGDFTQTDGAARAYAVAYATAGVGGVTPYAVSSSALNGQVLKQAYYDGNLYLAANGPDGGTCLSVDATTGAANWSYPTDGNVQAVTAFDGVAYCGGHFATITSDAVRRQHVAAVDVGSTAAPVTDWAPRVNSIKGVWAMANNGTTLLIGGDFTRVGKSASNRFAQFTP